MKTNDVKLEFIKMRAEGNSYSNISEKLSISKHTCTEWEREFKEVIGRLKAEQLEELYSSYFMLKEQRVKQLGGTLKKINEALEEVDLSEMAPDKLLDFKLKYIEALKAEYVDINAITPLRKGCKAKDIMNNGIEVLNELRSGNITPEQAQRESQIMGNLLKAYESVELEERLSILESSLDGRY